VPEGKEGYTPEELKMEESRAVSDAELLKGGAEYEDHEGKKLLNPTEEQIESLREESADAVFSRILEESGDTDAINQAEGNIKNEKNRSYYGLESAVYWASQGNLKRTIAYLAVAELPAEIKCKVLGLAELAGAEIHYAEKGDEWSKTMVESSKEQARMLFKCK